jgi:hypothetical protein
MALIFGAGTPCWAVNASIDFNGTTSKLEHATATLVTGSTFTVVAWVYAEGRGEANIGEICVLPESGNAIQVRHTDADNNLTFLSNRITDGIWTFPANDNTWNGIAISYESIGAAAPVGRIMAGGGAAADITFTETATPSGSQNPYSSGFCVGNITGQTITFDGRIAYLQVFDSALSSGNKDAAMQTPGSVTSTLTLYLPMQGAADVGDDSGNGFDGTATALLDGADGPPYPSSGGTSGAAAHYYRQQSSIDRDRQQIYAALGLVLPAATQFSLAP